MNKYTVSIKGKNTDYFLKKIINNGIKIYNISKSKNELILVVDADGYKKIRNIKTSYVIDVLDVSGMLKLKGMFYKYLVFILFFLFGVLLNIFLSCVIFEVEVIHSNKYIRELVYDALEKYGISKFKFKVSFKKKENIIQKILENEKDDIEWLEIKNVGCKYIVNVEQRKKNIEYNVCNNRNVVASKNATILAIEAEDGEVVKKKLDYVLKDEIIISGVIHNKEDIVSNRCASGKVFGEVWYKVVVELPKKYNEVSKTGNKSYKVKIKFLDKEKILFNNFSTYKSENLFSIDESLLPISISFVKCLETNEVNYIYNLDNVDDVAIDMAYERFKHNLGEEDEVLSKKVLKKEEKKSKIIVDVFFKVKENITAYKEIVDMKET